MLVSHSRARLWCCVCVLSYIFRLAFFEIIVHATIKGWKQPMCVQQQQQEKNKERKKKKKLTGGWERGESFDGFRTSGCRWKNLKKKITFFFRCFSWMETCWLYYFFFFRWLQQQRNQNNPKNRNRKSKKINLLRNAHRNETTNFEWIFYKKLLRTTRK